MVNQGKTPPLTSTTSLAEAMRNTRPATQTAQSQDPALENLISQGAAKSGFDSPELKAQYEAEQERLQTERARAQEINPVDTHEVFAAAEAKTVRELEVTRQEISAIVEQKEIQDPEIQKPLVSQLTNAGPEGTYLRGYFAQLLRTVQAFIPQPPEQIFQKRQARRRGGAAVNYEETARVQKDLTNSESNIHRGGGQ